MNLLAHSFGPVLAARYAQAYPERGARIIFLGAIGPRKADARAYAQTMYARMDTVTRDSIIALVRALTTGTGDAVVACRAHEDLLKQWSLTQGDSTPQKGTTCAAPPSAVRYAHLHTSQMTFQSFGDWDYTGTLGHVSAPLLVIYGDRDASPISSQRAWAAAVPNGRLLVVPGARKAVHVDRLDLFFATVDTFLSGRWPDAAVPVAVDK
jgi:proline iminopeptidase